MKNILTALLIIIAASSLTLYLIQLKDKTITERSYNSVIAAKQLRIDRLKDSISVMEDSIFKLEIQIGFAAIEKDKAKIKIENRSANYKEAKSNKDTIKQLKECDTLIFTELPFFLTKDSAYAVLNDTLSYLNTRLKIVTDSTIYMQDQFNQYLQVKLDSCNADKVKQVEKLKKRNKTYLIGGIVGSVIAIIGSIF